MRATTLQQGLSCIASSSRQTLSSQALPATTQSRGYASPASNPHLAAPTDTRSSQPAGPLCFEGAMFLLCSKLGYLPSSALFCNRSTRCPMFLTNDEEQALSIQLTGLQATQQAAKTSIDKYCQGLIESELNKSFGSLKLLSKGQ